MRIDLHTHGKLSKASDFSVAYFEEMVREAKASGLQAIALTEHFNTRRFDEVYRHLDLLYPYQGDYYEAGGLRIYPGMEVDIRETGHILLIGRRESVLALRQSLDGHAAKDRFIPFRELMDLADGYPLLRIGAHPFRESTPLHHVEREQLRRLDAFDLNGKDLYEYGVAENRGRVEAFAASLGMPVTAGSDTHQCLQYGCVANAVTEPFGSVEELRELIRTGRFAIEISDELPLKVKASSMLKKLMKRIASLEAELAAEHAGAGGV